MYENKTVLIAGGSSGIGEALVRQFSNRGSQVYSFDIQAPQSRLEGVRYEIADVCGPNSLRAALSEIAGPIDYFIISAGIRDEESPEGLKMMFDVNMNGAANLFGLSKTRVASNAKIVQISSDLARTLSVPISGYAASKLAAYNVAKQFAALNEGFDVKIAFPGPIDTPLFRRGKSAERIAGIKPRSPEYLAEMIIALIESDKKELVCMNDVGVWTYVLR